MSTWEWVLIGIGLAVILVLVAAWAERSRRSRRLRSSFGPEYDRAVSNASSRREAEAELEERERRHEGLELNALSEESRSRYEARWHDTQALFVDDPHTAVWQADSLVAEVMRERGYPVDGVDFDTRLDVLSVDYPRLVQNYRDARAIADANTKDRATTEELRGAIVLYRALFDDLLSAREPAQAVR
ncbi:MAG: hypothetical protein ACXVRK_11900 [Gaiellaceae bacterium]